jgi:hypothetical protein
VFGASEDLDEIVSGEQRSQHQQAREVELTGGDRVEQRGKAAHETGGSDATKRLVFREPKLVNAIAVEARASASAMDAARFDLPEVREQARQELVRATDEPSRDCEQLRVGELSRCSRCS